MPKKKIPKEFKGNIPDKFRKKFHCTRCKSFFVDTKEELEFHMESLHGEYSAAKHHANRKGSRKLKQIYLNRNIKKKPEVPPVEERKSKKKRKLKSCFAFRCKNCKRVGVIYADINKKLQNFILCPIDEEKPGIVPKGCGANIFVDSRSDLIALMTKKGMSPIQFKDWCGVDVTKFEGYKEVKYKGKGKVLDGFVNRRNGKK